MLNRDADALCEKNKSDLGRVLQEINFHEAKKAKMLTLTKKSMVFSFKAYFRARRSFI